MTPKTQTHTQAIIGKDPNGQFIGTVNPDGQMHIQRANLEQVAQFAFEHRQAGRTFTGQQTAGNVTIELIV